MNPLVTPRHRQALPLSPVLHSACFFPPDIHLHEQPKIPAAREPARLSAVFSEAHGASRFAGPAALVERLTKRAVRASLQTTPQGTTILYALSPFGDALPPIPLRAEP